MHSETIVNSTPNRQVWLRSRPTGIPRASDFGLREVAVPTIEDGAFLVRNEFLSADPAMRGWITDRNNYASPVEIGDTMRAFAAGVVVESRNDAYAIGDRVMGLFGWQEYAAATPAHVWRKVGEHDLPLSLSLGVLGLNGLTAYFGLLDVLRPVAGETVVVSTAAGSVGSAVGQIAKIKGCRTVGVAGGPDKVRQCVEEFGYDAAIDYKGTDDLETALVTRCVLRQHLGSRPRRRVGSHQPAGAHRDLRDRVVSELGTLESGTETRAALAGQARHHARLLDR